MLESILRSLQNTKNQTEKAKPQLIAVTSPHGSTGKTTVANNIALELAAEKHKVLIIDADLEGASVANYFCLSDVPAGLVGAIRIANQNRFDASQLERLSVQVPRVSLSVLPGAMAGLTTELTEKTLTSILQTAIEVFDFVIIDLGSISKKAQELEFDITRSVIKQAGQLILVASADPIGIFRLLGIETAILELHSNPKLVINRLRNSVINQAKIEIKTTLSRLGSIEICAFLPDDPAHVDQATRVGLATPVIGRPGSFKSAVGIFTKSAILGKLGALDARVAKLG